MKSKIDQWAVVSGPNYDDALKCYHCGGENLHQTGVLVFFRQEDADIGLVVNVSPDGAQISHKENQALNPSDRRDGITICMDCEFCGKHSFYHIVQHKGFTLTFMSGVMKNKQ